MATACLVGNNERIWLRTSSGKLAIMSSSSSCFAFFVRRGLEI